MEYQDIIGAAFVRTTFDTLDLTTPKPEIKSGYLIVKPEVLGQLAYEAFRRTAFYLRQTHINLLADILEQEVSSENDRYVAQALLRNAVIASNGVFPLCQDTGTATIMAWKDERVITGGNDETALEQGITLAYDRHTLRSSQVGAFSFFDEFDTGNNLPAQIHIEATYSPTPSYRFLCVPKGAGSTNKTSLYMLSKAILEEEAFDKFLKERVTALGTAACPPYRLALVVGGTSPEENLRILKLASTEILDAAPYFQEGETKEEMAHKEPWLRRDLYWEQRLFEHAKNSGLGAQFGGSSLILDARVLRLPRHAGSCPVSIGVSCSAHRNILAFIDSQGVHMEHLEEDPKTLLLERGGMTATLLNVEKDSGTAYIHLDGSMDELRKGLSRLQVGDRILFSGSLLVARDAAHLKWHKLIIQGQDLPAYLFQYPIFYAGPAGTPPGKMLGSLGPTTAQRMDPYGEELMSRGASLITLAKGNRDKSWKGNCHRFGGFYLGTIGGAAALLAEENILESEILDYPELGMEAVRRIVVRNLPVFLLMDDKGNDLYENIAKGMKT